MNTFSEGQAYDRASKRFMRSTEIQRQIAEAGRHRRERAQRRWRFWMEFGEGLLVSAIILALAVLAMFAL